MKLKESKGMSLIVFTIVLAVLVVLAGGVIVYLLNNPVKEKVAIQTPSSVQTNMSNDEKIEEKNETISSSNVNVVDNKATSLVVINDEQNIKAEGKIYEYISEEGSSAEVPVEISYIVNGNNKGNIQIKYNNKVVYNKKAEKNIIEFNRIKDAFDSDIFVLYEDGTVGKISISNIKNNKYNIVKVENCENVVRIQELVFEYENSGADYALVAVDNNGKTVTLATYSV